MNFQIIKLTFIIIIFHCASASLNEKSLISILNNRNGPKLKLREKEKLILDYLFSSENYDSMIRPPGENGTGPTIVSINLYVRSIETIDDVKMEYKLQLTFRQNWIDDRLRFEHLDNELIYLTLTETSLIWMPDLFYSNEKQGHIHKNLKPNLYVRIFPNGEVLYSIRISLTLACPMQLRLYPLDKQTCSIFMASYGWTTLDLVFLWKEKEPVQIAKGIQIFKFVLHDYKTHKCDSHTATGTYSCLRADFNFFREFRYYMINIYLPSCLLIIVSWVSFWLDHNAVPARVTLGVTTLLAISNLVSNVNSPSSLPPVSYTKALDVWTGVSLAFIFSALLEFALVNYASRADNHRARILKEKKEKEEKEKAELEKMEKAKAEESQNEDQNEKIKKFYIVNSEGQATYIEGYSSSDFLYPNQNQGIKEEKNCEILNICNKIELPDWFSKITFKKFPSKAKRIDIIARIIFPILFILFNITYWSAYLDPNNA